MKTITYKELSNLLGNFVSVSNAPSRNGMGKAPNQFIIEFENGRVLQSYETPVAAKCNGQLYFGSYHDYSATTNRFVKDFCGRNKNERNKLLENDEAILFEV